MSEPSTSKRSDLIRATVVFQLKLMADGLRAMAAEGLPLAAASIDTGAALSRLDALVQATAEAG